MKFKGVYSNVKKNYSGSKWSRAIPPPPSPFPLPGLTFVPLNSRVVKSRMTADRLAQLVEHRTTVREVVGSNPGRTNTQGL